MPVFEHSKRIPLRPWLAAAILALAGAFAACSFPEDDYGFATDKPKDAAPDGKPDAPVDAASEEASIPAEGGDVAPEAAPDVVEEPDAASEDAADALEEADAPEDVTPDVAPDVKPDVVPDVSPDVLPDVVEAGPDVQPDVQTLPPLNVWHIPTNPEPVNASMRNPRYPAASGDAFIYFGIQPIGATTGAKLHWWWSGETTPHDVDFAWDTNNGSNEYWKASFKMPARPIGTFRYYIEVSPKNASQNATTYLYGTDSTTNKTTTKSIASASPYKPDLRLPTAAGDGGVSEIVITEVMVNALGTPENVREWFEVYSAASVPVTLEGCKIGDNTAVNVINNPELILWPGVYAVFGGSLDSNLVGGFVPDFMWTAANMELSNSGDLVKVMLPDNTMIDIVNWDGTGFGVGLYGQEGKTMQHTAQPPNPSTNDLPTTWCLSKKPYGLGTSYGTPQAATDLCAP